MLQLFRVLAVVAALSSPGFLDFWRLTWETVLAPDSASPGGELPETGMCIDPAGGGCGGQNG